MWPLADGRGVTVAVIDDDGLNRRLPDFRGAQILPAVNPGGSDKVPSKAPPRGKEDDHVNGMASLIVGQGHGTGMVGVAPKAKLLPIISDLSNAIGVAEDIRYATDGGAQVISMSLGWPTQRPCPEVLQQAVDYAVRKDVVLVASAGNEGRDGPWQSRPANCAGVVAVGGLDGQVKPWKHTTPGRYVTVAAPADQISDIDRNGNFTVGQRGTSAAAALTTGVVALIRSRYPKMPAREVVQRLIATAKDTGPKGWDDVTGYGLVRPYRALVDKVPPTAPNPVYDRVSSDHEHAAAKLKQPKASGAERDKGTPAAGSEDLPIWTIVAFLAGLAFAITAWLCVRRRGHVNS
ncbi:S8 family serine peptidase [Spirillospora sp. NPDC127200]